MEQEQEGKGGERREGEGGGGRREGEEKEEEGGREGSSLFGKRAVYPPSNPFTILSELSHENHSHEISSLQFRHYNLTANRGHVVMSVQG